MAGTPSTVDYLLKTIYFSNDSIEQWAKNTLLYQLLKRDSTFVEGTAKSSGFKWPIEDVRNTRGGAFSLSDMKFTPPGGRLGTQATSSLKGSEIGVIFDDILFDAAKTSEQAFYNVTKRNMTTLFEDMRNIENRMMWSDGSGVLGTVASVSGTKVTLADSGLRYFPLTLYIQPGQLITFLDSSYATIANQASIAVVSVDDEAGTFEIADTTGLGATNVIVNNFAHDAGSSTGNEPTGLLAQLGSASTTLYGIAPADHPLWIPGYVLNTNTDPSDAIMKLANTRIKMKGGDSDPKTILTSPLAQDKYALSLIGMRRMNNTTEAMGGIDGTKDLNKLDGISIANVGTMYADNSCPQGTDPNTSRMAIFNADKIKIEQGSDLHWFEQNGQILFPLTGSASVGAESVGRWVAYAVHYFELINMKRNAGAMLNSVNVLQA